MAVQDIETSNQKHILFIDDSPVLLRTVKGFMPAKYKISVAINAEQAFKMIDGCMPDLICMDYEMPDVNGAELLKLFRKREDMVDVPVVFLTAQSGPDLVSSMVDLKPAGYVLKPPSQERIMNVVEKMLHSKE